MKAKISSILFILSFILSFGQNLDLGMSDRFNINKLDFYKDSGKPKLVVFMPSLSPETDYASMLTQAYYYYFVQSYAFTSFSDKPEIDIILIVNKNENSVKSSLVITDGMTVAFDPEGKYLREYKLSPFKSDDDSSVLFFLNSENKIELSDFDYRGQGEHLKPLEHKIKKTLYKDYEILEPAQPDYKKLQVGDKAPNIELANGKKAEDYKGKIVVLTYYPAAFSGTFPEPGIFNLPVKDNSMSCAVQINSLDEILQSYKDDVEFFAISSSTPELLKEWQLALGTDNIQYVNDENFSKTLLYNAYNEKGYSERVTVVIDQKGEIALYDDSYSLNIDAALIEILHQLL